MKLYVFSIAAGILVGTIYGLLNVRSPAPPVVALLGLLGILVGEQVTAAARRVLNGDRVDSAWLRTDCAEHILGRPIGCPPPPAVAERATSAESGPDVQEEASPT